MGSHYYRHISRGREKWEGGAGRQSLTRPNITPNRPEIPSHPFAWMIPIGSHGCNSDVISCRQPPDLSFPPTQISIPAPSSYHLYTLSSPREGGGWRWSICGPGTGPGSEEVKEVKGIVRLEGKLPGAKVEINKNYSYFKVVGKQNLVQI